VLGDLTIVPVAGSEHADGKFGGAEIVGDIVTGVWIVHAAPAPGKTIGDVDDALEIFGPFWLDDDFEHAAEKAVVLAEGFDEIVRLSQLPGCEQMRFSAGRVFQAHGVHDGDEMEIDGGDGIDGALKIQRIFHHSDAAGVIASEVFLMRLHIHGELAQARRQIFEGGGKLRHLIRKRQMQEHACCGHDEKSGGAQLGRRVRIKCINALLHTHKRRSGTLDLAKSEIGVGKDQTSGKAQRRFVAVKVAFCDRCSIFGPSAEISEFRASDLTQVGI